MTNLSDLTLKQIFEIYMEVHGKPHCKSWENMERCFNAYLAHWSDRPVSSLMKLEIKLLHTRLGESSGETTANRVVELIAMLFNTMVEYGLTIPNPAARIKKFKLKPRERFLERDEVKRFLAAADTLRYGVTRDFLHMCLFTAARRANVAAMEWRHINIEQRIWYLPETKNGLSQYIPLTDEAMAVLARRRANCGDSPWVFPSQRSKSGHLTKPEEAWKMVVERSGLENFRLHDLRRTHASWQALTGANLSVISATLNHKDIQSTQIYARLNVDAVRSAMEKANKSMLEDFGS